ncbi:DUF4156 domain-containing protein [Salmonella enterica]|uniref:DUF4156 domain-containing protein n=2 Tax=Salmonella enterica I TaxID=59201 RepID=A0A8E6Y4M7_SALPU|nr:DUF4156 domain-containing protein [Salmonella enterica]MCZ7105924.1 DUF4156 domain-containing protein [Salmonella enterica]QVT75593.1 DUF4156 domain-containing protein [Salmonella enterica subsp. enterica serovar Pullorum]HAE8132428.1 DUF4156 domain-containing protein [Salmonella enterica subsp. enterica serovar Gallinarum]
MKKILVCFAGLALTACSANSLNYGAEQVRVMTSEPGKECSYLGDITGSQGNFFTGGWTSNSNLEAGARNDLKNKAYKMGGNTVVLLTQRAGQTGSSWHGSGSSKQTNVTLSGNVYRCPR